MRKSKLSSTKPFARLLFHLPQWPVNDLGSKLGPGNGKNSRSKRGEWGAASLSAKKSKCGGYLSATCVSESISQHCVHTHYTSLPSCELRVLRGSTWVSLVKWKVEPNGGEISFNEDFMRKLRATDSRSWPKLWACVKTSRNIWARVEIFLHWSTQNSQMFTEHCSAVSDQIYACLKFTTYYAQQSTTTSNREI